MMPVRREPSSRLKFMLEEVNQAFGHARDAVLSAYNQAISEGFMPHEAKKLILSSVKTISPRTIYLYLPNESKDKRIQSLAFKKNSLQNCNGTGKIDKTSQQSNSKSNLQHDKNEKSDKLENQLEGHMESYESRTIILPELLANAIFVKVNENHIQGRPSKFWLEHDGLKVTNIYYM